MSKVLKLPEQEYLKKRFIYEEGTGNLYWNIMDLDDTSIEMAVSSRKRCNTRLGGKPAGHVFKSTAGTYSMQVRIDGKSYYVHRIIFKMCTGIDAEIIDHEDGDPLNNRIGNLRDTTIMGNAKNMKKHKKNKSGTTGVSWSKANNKWEAYIWHKCKKYNLGLHVDIEDAKAARYAKEVYFGYHSNHGQDRDFTEENKQNKEEYTGGR